MYVTAVSIGSRGAAYQVLPSAQVARLGSRALRADLSIDALVDQVLANKQLRDIRAAACAARRCGCPHCRQAYRLTLAFYAGLGLRPPAREAITTRVLTRYTQRGGASPSERQ